MTKYTELDMCGSSDELAGISDVMTLSAHPLMKEENCKGWRESFTRIFSELNNES